METANAVALGRAAFERRAWADAYIQLTAADRDEVLGADDLRRLATAAYLTGRDVESIDLWDRAYRAFLDSGDVPSAVRCAFWLVLGLMNRGETARGGGWLARAHRQLDAVDQELAEHGYLLFPVGFQRFMTGDFAGAHAAFTEAARIGEQCDDADLLVLARHAQGRALLRTGDTDQGLALLDEAMVAITADETSPMIAGDVYCSVIEACQEIFDVHRATEWTAALTQWCAQQPDLVPYRGQCLVHRSQLSQLHGDWHRAMDEAQRACARLSEPPGQPALGMAWYQQAELHRLRGARGGRGHLPQGQRAGARAAAGACAAQPVPGAADRRGGIDPAGGRRGGRGPTGSLQAAARLCGDHARRRRRVGCQASRRRAGRARGAPRRAAARGHGCAGRRGGAAGRGRRGGCARRVAAGVDTLVGAAGPLRGRARAGARRRRVPTARDHDGARLEWDAARQAFAAVNALPDLRRLDELTAPHADHAPGGLSRREREVLALVAAGKTNREIADELVISRHTVRRHLQNVFAKLGVSSRAAATAHAYQHDLV